MDNETITPSSLSQALKAKAGRDVMAIAGGTDLMVRLHDMIDRHMPRLLVLDGISTLRKIKIGEKNIVIGSLTTFSDIENSKTIRDYAYPLWQAAILAGSSQIRNRATIGGNIANGSPAGDLIPPLFALNAILELSSSKGKRIVPVEDFFIGPGKTILKSNELITSIKFAKDKCRGFFLRLGTRQALAISKISVAAIMAIKSNHVINARIALGAVAPTVIRARKAEEFLIGKKLDKDIICQAGEIAKGETRPIDDLRSTAEYRQEMVAVLLRRGLTEAITKVS